MKRILICALVLSACSSAPADNDPPAATAGVGIKVDSATGAISVDTSVVPTAASCAEGQVVMRTATGWACSAAAPDAMMLGGKPAAAYATADGTIANATSLGGHSASFFLPASAKAADSARLNGRTDADFLFVAGTAANSSKLNGHPDTDFLAASGTAADSAKLGGQPASTYLSTTGTAANSMKLGGQPASAFLAASATAANSTRLGGWPAGIYARTDVEAGMAMPLTVTAADGSVLKLGGKNNGIFGSNSAGNLHLDAASSGQTYFNWTSGNGVVFGNGTSSPAPVASVDSAGNVGAHSFTATPVTTGGVTTGGTFNGLKIYRGLDSKPLQNCDKACILSSPSGTCVSAKRSGPEAGWPCGATFPEVVQCYCSAF
jgi:hypothetical protein